MLRCLFVCFCLTLAVDASATDTLSIPPIAYQQRTLANGLQVIAIEDHTSPTVAVQVWYHVGSKDDPSGRSGFAHLFEHLMFKATKHLKAEQFDRLTEDVGGHNNASTNDDNHIVIGSGGVRPQYYYFPSFLPGVDDNGRPTTYANLISDEQKDMVRTAYDVWARYLGIQVQEETSGRTVRKLRSRYPCRTAPTARPPPTS